MSMTLQGTRWYSIREAAQLTGLTESTLRYYESVKVLPPAHRDESSGHRIYSEPDIDALLTVSCLNATGMPLGDMREYLQANRKGAPLPSAQIALLQGQQARLREQARMLKMKQKYLALKVRYWQTCDTGMTTRRATSPAKLPSSSKSCTVLSAEFTMIVGIIDL